MQKEESKKTLETDQDFPQFLKKVRKEENVLLEQLSQGLMTVSQLARIEKGQRPISKDMRDRLLGRLGIASDLYENLLSIEDYTAWEQQRNILCAVEAREIQKAQELLAEYEEQEPRLGGGDIKQQFCLVMRAEVLKQLNADQQEIGACYEKAVKLTVPDIENMNIDGKLLCIQEVNMILEYEYYHKGEDFAEKCKELIAFVENSVYDDLSKVKIYPKIVYYYLKEIYEKQVGRSTADIKECLIIYNRAIEMLRNTGRAYFLLELLELEVKIVKCTGEVQDVDEGLSLQESMELVQLLKQLCSKYEASAYMQDCTYLYHQRWMFYVGDVLRIRRQMYGFTQRALCEGNCSVRTLRRAEKREMNMQNGVLGILLEKLGLSKEFQKARLVTNDREVLKLREQVASCRNNRELDKAREILGQIKKRVSMEIPENQQYFMETEASLDWLEGKISKEEYVEREVAALQCTLNVKDLYQLDEVYLTEMELLCVRNRIQGIDEIEKRNCIDFLLRFFENYEKKGALSDCISMYEYVMVCVVGELGNMKEHQLAIELNKKLLREELACKRVREISNILYDITWNTNRINKYNGHQTKSPKMTDNLMQCIKFSHFCKRTFLEDFFNSKIH